MAEPFDIVRAGYDEIGDTYRDRSRLNPVRLHWVQRALAMLPAGAVVVDLGCGSGEPATRLLADAHNVIGIDGSAAQLRLAREAAPSALLVQADITSLALRAQSVDAVTSFYALGHIPSDHHAALFRSIADWLRPGGVLLTNAPTISGDQTEPNWLGTPMFFGGIGEEATKQAIADAGLSLEIAEVVPEDEGQGRVVAFLWIVARKPPVT